MTRPVVAEISGADSIAAALAYCLSAGSSGEPLHLLPTYAETGTEHGDRGAIERNVDFLASEAAARCVATSAPLVTLADLPLWRALNGRFVSVIAGTFGAWTPCTGCHLYLHLMRIPFARGHGATVVVAGERERHDERTKPNQVAGALDAYAAVLATQGIELALPVRGVAEGAEVTAMLGPGWSGGSPQLACVLSGNYAGLDGACRLDAMPAAYFSDFLLPVGVALAAAMPATGDVYDDIVADALRAVRG